MNPIKLTAAAAVAAFALTPAAFAQSNGVQRLYILECGQGHTGDMSRWTPGQNVNVPMDIVDNCYLIKHAQGYMMWDTGVADSTPANPPPRQSGRHYLAPPEDARGPACRTRRQARRCQIRRDLAYPSGPCRQCGAVPEVHAAGAEGRI